ncbi:uncharacterized protein [Rutidosis leptorrhynchoides]|uniref:uncharacterized protein n=1 Tax=Rutidosis leptorrhynchoides TaxID=125765 RepID=UPI003A99F818
MSFLNLHQPENDLTINILRVPTSSSSSLLSSLNNVEQRVFSCSYCRRKFYSPQAFGGHQNAHKLERTLAKKSRELSSAARHQEPAERTHTTSRFDSNGSTHVEQLDPTVVTGFQQQEKVGWTEEMGGNLDYGCEGDNVENDFNCLDLSLKL